MTSPQRAYSAEYGMRRYAVEGMVPHPLSVTSLLRVIAPGIALVKWMDKRLIGAALDSFQNNPNVDHATHDGMEARWAGSDEADLGTSVHVLTEEADRKLLGQIPEIRPVADMKKCMGYLKQWEKLRDSFEMQILGIEVTFVNTKFGYAGTADRIVIVPAISQDPIILDIKSGKGIYPDVALQCSALANCDKILYDDGTLADNPYQLDLKLGAVAHVRPRSGHLSPLNIERAWPLFQPLPQLALWRTGQIDVLGAALEPDPVAQLRADLRLRITQLPPDIKKHVRETIKDDPDLGDGTTDTWDEKQLVKVTNLFVPFETEARNRLEQVLLLAGERGEVELRTMVRMASSGRTALASELDAREVDTLIDFLKVP